MAETEPTGLRDTVVDNDGRSLPICGHCSEGTDVPEDNSRRSVPAMLVIMAIRVYQRCLSPLLGRHCRFHPSCSQYSVLAVQKYGVIRGCWRGFLRICRCHPWNAGGYDPP